MYSIRKNGILLSAIVSASCVAGGGCASIYVPTVVATPQPIADQPKADEATEIRGFQKSVAAYHSGATEAWATRWYYNPDPDNFTPYNYVADPIMFLFETASLPGTLAIEPPFEKIEFDPKTHRLEHRSTTVVYAGDVLPPSYNALPPLPPTLSISPSNPDPDPLSAPHHVVAPPLPPVPEERPPLIVPPPPPKPAKSIKPAPMAAPTTRPAR